MYIIIICFICIGVVFVINWINGSKKYNNNNSDSFNKSSFNNDIDDEQSRNDRDFLMNTVLYSNMNNNDGNANDQSLENNDSFHDCCSDSSSFDNCNCDNSGDCGCDQGGCDSGGSN